MTQVEAKRLRVLHTAVSMTPSLGVIKQMEWEQQAANELGIPWRVVLHTPHELESPIVHSWKNLSSHLLPRYFLLRKSFHGWLKNVEKDYDLIILRHSVHDVFEARLVALHGNKIFTLHHTLEAPELRRHGVWGPLRARLETWLGSKILANVLGRGAVTNEILKYELARSLASTIRPSFVYPNGVYIKPRKLMDEREGDPELLFVASFFSEWHGLDRLIVAAKKCNIKCKIHIVGAVSAEDRLNCTKDNRFVVHGLLSTADLQKLMPRIWCGISSFAMDRNGMREACNLKVREYLDAGIPVYASHKDIAFPAGFKSFRQGEVSLEKIVEYSEEMRLVSRDEIRNAAEPYISKTVLLQKLYNELEDQVSPLLINSGRTVLEIEKKSSESGLVAVTGGSGFIGKALVRKLIQSGWRVRLLTRKRQKWMDATGIEIYVGDLVETKDWSGFLNGADILLNMAAELRDESRMRLVNVEGSTRLLQAAISEGIKRWVQLSSVGAYGSVRSGWVSETTPEKPDGVYEVTKTIFDGVLKEAERNSDLAVTILRPSNVYGPEMTNQSLFQMMKMIRKGYFSYVGPFSASTNYVHVDDVVQAISLVLDSPVAKGKTYIVSCWNTVENMVSGMCEGMGISEPVRRLPLRLLKFMALVLERLPGCPLTTARVEALSVRSRYNTHKIERELGWHAKVPVRVGMRDLAKWFNSNLCKEGSLQRKSALQRVLIVSYDWPPRNSIATHRPYSWAKYWAAQGLDVTVLTATKKFFDAPLDLDLPGISGVRVIESNYNSLIPAQGVAQGKRASFVTGSLKALKSLVSRVLGFEYDVRSNWARCAERMINELGTEFDLVVSTYGPDSAHKIASKFKSANPSIFWVADYRDLWSLNARSRHSRLIKALVRRSELRVVRSADMMSTVSAELSESLFSLFKKRAFVAFNGFDLEIKPEKFELANPVPGKKIHIVYTGRIYLGKRSPLILASAIHNLIKSGQLKQDSVNIDFYGLNTKEIENGESELKTCEFIRHHGHVSRPIALDIQEKADFLLLLESGDEDSKGFLTGKIFEYIGAGRPIISLGSNHGSAIERVLSETGCGKCYVNDEGAIANDLNKYATGVLPIWFSPNASAIEKYTRKYQANLMLDEIKRYALN